MSESTSISTSNVIGKFRPCRNGSEPCTLGQSLEAFHRAGNAPRSIPLKDTSGNNTTFFGEGVMKFPALFTPRGSDDSFQAHLYLRSTVQGDLPSRHLTGAHMFSSDINILSPMIEMTLFGDRIYHRPNRLEMLELDVYDTQCSIVDENGVRTPGFAIERGDVGYDGNRWKISRSSNSWDQFRCPWNTKYRGKMWLSIPGYDPETGTVRSDDTLTNTAACAGAESQSDRCEGQRTKQDDSCRSSGERGDSGI